MEQGITFTRKLLYAQGCLGMNVVNLAVVTWVIYFYSGGGGREPLVSVALAGVIVGIGRLIDVISDPLIGYWSDNASFKTGRRRPFIFWGAPLLALSFFLIWLPPVAGESVWNLLWLFLFVNLFFTAFTIAGVPYRSVVPDIAPTSRERIGVSAWMAVLGIVGVIIASAAGGPVIETFGYPAMGAILGVIVLISFWVSLLGVKERPRSEGDLQIGLSLFRALSETFKNRHFLAFAVGIVCFQVGFQIQMIVLPFLVSTVLGQGEGQVMIYQGAFILVMLAAVPIWMKIGVRIGKRRGQLIALLLSALVSPFFFLVGFLPVLTGSVQAILYFILAAIPIAGLYVYPNAIVGDITDYDELKTHKRREAMYYAGFGLLEKAAWAAAAFLVAAILPLFGFTAANPMGIRLVGPLIGLVSLIGWFGFRYYGLPDVVKGKTLMQIEGNTLNHPG